MRISIYIILQNDEWSQIKEGMLLLRECNKQYIGWCVPFRVQSNIYSLKNSCSIIYISSPFNSGLVQQAMHENCKGQKDHDKKNYLYETRLMIGI